MWKHAAGLALAACILKASPNVLLITVDTLRADHLSCYGYHLETSPNIDALAAEGVRFARAHTAIPLTGPAHISLLTSRYPQEHGAIRNGVAPREESSLVFLPQVLRRHGYRTAAFVSAWPLTTRLTHLGRWFDRYDEDLPRRYQLFNSMRHAEDVTPAAIRWLEDNHGERFFLWVHFFDPHSPYEYRMKFSKLKRSEGQPRPAASAEMRDRIQRYDSEVAYTDYWVGRLVASLDRLGLRDSTLVVLTADHGESLGEHNYVGHGRHLYQNIVHIPLIFRFPQRIAGGQVEERPVSLLDITPTIVDLVVEDQEVRAKLKAAFSGRSLANSLLTDEPPLQRPIRYLTFAGKKGFFPQWLAWLWTDSREGPLRIGTTEGARKLIWTPGSKRLAAYNLQEDPFELRPSVIRPRSADFERETAQLDQWFRATYRGSGASVMTEEDVEVLRSLGYLQ